MLWLKTVPSTRTKPWPVALEISADKLAGGPFEDLQDFAGRAKVGAARLAGDADQHFIAGGGVEGVAFADQDVRAELAVDGVRPDEAEASGCTPEAAGNGTVGFGRANRLVFA